MKRLGLGILTAITSFALTQESVAGILGVLERIEIHFHLGPKGIKHESVGRASQ